MKSETRQVELLTFCDGLYSGILTSDRILVTTSSDTSWEQGEPWLVNGCISWSVSMHGCMWPTFSE